MPATTPNREAVRDWRLERVFAIKGVVFLSVRLVAARGEEGGGEREMVCVWESGWMASY